MLGRDAQATNSQIAFELLPQLISRPMQSRFDLWSHDDVSRHAEAILARLRDGSMPCDGAWPPAQVATRAKTRPPKYFLI